MIDPLQDYPGYLLRRASALTMTQLAGKLRAARVRPTEATVILTIHANADATPSDIGRLLEIASANMAPLVARLEAEGLIERTPVDGRSHGLSLTAKGRAKAKQLNKIVATHEAALLAKIPAQLRQAFLEVLRNIWQDDRAE